jgi:hypothetical protein
MIEFVEPPHVSEFFDIGDYSENNLRSRYPGHANTIVIVGGAGTGTSSLKANLQTYFPTFLPLSGGDYQRMLASKGEAKVRAEHEILELSRQNALNPEKGTDRKCDAFLRHKIWEVEQGRVPYEGVIIEARCGHIVSLGRGCNIYLKCADEIRAGRIWDDLCAKAKKEGTQPPSFAEVYEMMMERDLNDQHLFEIYPGSHHSQWNFATINTGVRDKASAAEFAARLFNSFRERVGLVPNPDAALMEPSPCLLHA